MPDLHIVIGDFIKDIENLIQLSTGDSLILQRCKKHVVNAIKARLITKDYVKKSRDIALDLIWK
jgi:hypothetical protein